jgi:hypothetical protein
LRTEHQQPLPIGDVALVSPDFTALATHSLPFLAAALDFFLVQARQIVQSSMKAGFQPLTLATLHCGLAKLLVSPASSVVTV